MLRARVRVVAGELVAKPFHNSVKPFVRTLTPSEAYGSHNPVLNTVPRSQTYVSCHARR